LKVFFVIGTACSQNIPYENQSVSGCSGNLFLKKNNIKKDTTEHTT
jgi:hypothetical protein